MCYAMRIHNLLLARKIEARPFFSDAAVFCKGSAEVVVPLASSTSGKRERGGSKIPSFLFFFVALTVLPNRNNRSDYSQCSKEKTKRATQTKTGASALPFLKIRFRVKVDVRFPFLFVPRDTPKTFDIQCVR
jgi:hypothetical protein